MALQVWIPGTTDFRDQGLNNSTIDNHDVTIDNNGKIGKCLCFDATSEYLMGSPGPIDSTSDWTFACWMKVNSSHNGCLFSQRTVESSAGIGIFYYKTQWIIDDGVRWRFTPGTAIQPDTWYHISIVRKSGVGKYLYVDGTLDSSTATTGNPTGINPDYFAIGNSQNSVTTVNTSNQFSGFLNDVRVYNHALSAKEIHILSQGLVIHYPLSREGFGNDNLLKSTNKGVGLWAWSANGGARPCEAYDTIGVKMTTATAANSGSWSVIRYGDTNLKNILQPNTEYTLSFDACFPNSGTIQCSIRNMNGLEPLTNTQNITVVANKWKHYSCKLTTVNTITISSQIIYLAVANVAPATTAGISIYFKNLKFELGAVATQWIPNSQDALYIAMGLDNNIVYDTSGNKYNGITHNITYSSDTPKRDVCSELNADNLSYIMVESNDWMVDKMSDLTINFWASTDDWTEQTTLHFFSCTEGGGFNTEKGSDGYLRFLCHAYTNETGTVAYKCSNTFLKLSDLSSGFHMFTFIYNTSGQKLYIDGELYNTYNATTYGLHFNKKTRLFIGCECTSTGKASAPYATMKVSDFRMYSTTLSADDIAALYHIPISVTNTGTLLTSGEFVEVY